MNIYIAGKYTARARLKQYKDYLSGRGHTVLSTWLDQHEGDYGTVTDEQMHQMAMRDAVEVTDANVFILDTLDESATGGREVELGMAIAQSNKYIYLVGPVRNIFHTLVSHFDTWEDLLNALEQIGK